ncbi:MAG: hypothetical protein AMXMBFR64_50090 [Myxococcales bacterium]
MLVLLASWVLTAGCGSGKTERYRDHMPVDVRAVTVQASILGPGDVFEVTVYQEKDLSGTYRVTPSGTIDFPLVGIVSVEGLSPAELADRLRDGLRQGYLRNPSVNVFVKEFNSKKVFVLGEVQKPGTFRYEESMNIVQAITLAGGFSSRASKNSTVVTRVEGSSELRIGVPVEDISEGRAPNFLLMPGDIVFVPESVL